MLVAVLGSPSGTRTYMNLLELGGHAKFHVGFRVGFVGSHKGTRGGTTVARLDMMLQGWYFGRRLHFCVGRGVKPSKT